MSDVWESLRQAFFMFWETLWALVLGFGLSGAVQAFVSRERMRRVMGDHRPAAVARAAGFGMVSSSCSYAATAMAKSLFQKGADFVTSMVFMFSSTNLVLELGVVLLILMGWQFAAAEFIGGAVMIVLLVLLGSYAFRNAARVRPELPGEPDTTGVRSTWRNKAGWADAASYTMSDITMLRKELVIGYVVAGFLMVLVPMTAWNDVFLTGHGFWTSLENVIVGPFIAVVSFVCSIGNVPLAAALWHGGISFGGVVAFIFADLITFPLLLIYRKYYGAAFTARLFVVFYVVMAVAGLIVEGLFGLFGAIPEMRHEHELVSHFEWNYTTFLNIVFLGVFAVLYWLHRNRERLGGGVGYATDPICGMQVQRAHAPARCSHAGTDYWFCSDRCHDRFETQFMGTSPPVIDRR